MLLKIKASFTDVWFFKLSNNMSFLVLVFALFGWGELKVIKFKFGGAIQLRAPSIHFLLTRVFS